MIKNVNKKILYASFYHYISYVYITNEEYERMVPVH